MENIQYKIGDRVKCIKNYGGRSEAVNEIGTVIKVSDFTIGVEFDVVINGHSCNNTGKEGYCWNLNKDYIELVKGKRGRKPKTPKEPEYHVIMQDDCKNIISGPAPYKEIVDRLTMNGNKTYTVYKLVPIANIQNKKMITKINISTKKKKKK